MVLMDANAAALVSGMRARRGLSMNTAAALVGVPVSTISRIESGKIDPTLSMLGRIATGLGFALTPAVAEAGSDAPFAAILRELQDTVGAQRRRVVSRLPSVAALAPVAQRVGVVRAGFETGLPEALSRMREEGQNPVVSSLEAFASDLSRARSFAPVVYVDDPNTVVSLSKATVASPQVMLLLPTTENVRAFTRETAQGAMVAREWGLLDALASPGRQADVALLALETLDIEPVAA